MTQAEIIEAINAQESIILDREAQLTATDYIAAKIAEGKATQEEYADKIAQRQQWRDDINAASDEIKRLKTLEPDPEGVPFTPHA
jgi:regulator of protease activity HflC (stomatin/prohibitin superfamily)